VSSGRSPAPRALAIRAPNWVGDLVMATPVIEAALACGRFERVEILVRAHLAPLLAAEPYAARVAAITDAASELAAYRRAAPEAVLLLGNSLGAAWRAFRARVPVRAGAALHGRRWLLTHCVVPARHRGRRCTPTAHLQRDCAGLLGIVVPELDPRLHVAPEEQVRADAALVAAGLGAGERYVLVAPGAAFGAAKLWPIESFARAAAELARPRGLAVVATGGPGEEALVDALAGALPAGVRGASLARQPRDQGQLKALVRGAELLLVGDSGPRWIAAAFDVPCVSVMGPNDPRLTATSLEWCEVVRRADLECSPCFQRTCPLGHHRCMRELPADWVRAAGERLLARRAALAGAR
jgi:heptosyltransferase-2